MTLRLGFLILFPLWVSSALVWASEKVDLSFDGVVYQPSSRAVRLVPGKNHRLSVTIPEANAQEVRARLTRRLPSGKTITETRSSGRQLVFDLGPFTAPGTYEYEAGAVYFRGYQIELELQGENLRKTWTFHQQLSQEITKERLGMGEGSPPVKALRLMEDGPDRVVFDPKLGSADLLALSLGSEVLLDQDRVSIQVGLSPGLGPKTMEGELRVLDSSGRQRWSRATSLSRQGGTRRLTVPVKSWPHGDYEVQFLPRLEGKSWPDGPLLTYRRRQTPKGRILLSPLSSWQLQMDRKRPEIRIQDFRQAHRQWGKGPIDPNHWKWEELSEGRVGLLGQGDDVSPPLTYRLPTQGTYAVFLGTAGSGLHIQIGANGLIRDAPPTQLGEETFVAAADLTDEVIRFYSSGDPKRWLDWGKAGSSRGTATFLRLVPVTPHSMRSLHQQMATPPTALLAVDDWAVYFDVVWARLLPDQFRSIVCGQAELGFGTIGWSIGRSWVEYHSRLPQTTRFPCASYEKAQQSRDYSAHDYGRRIYAINQHDALEQANRNRQDCQAQVWPWLAMQRHYGANSYGGMFSSPFYKNHPQWWRIAKDGSDSRGLSYFFPQVRKERVDILVEVAERGADGLLVGCDRQVPMLLYNPEMVEAYRATTGVDPRKIDVSDTQPYRDWIRWRADFFTQVLRDLKTRLHPLRTPDNRPIPVAVRIPSAGLFNNLAQGLDIEQWCRENLIDQLQLDPLQDLIGKADQDIRPYLELGRRHGIRIVAGMGASAYIGAGGTHSWTHVTEPDGSPKIARGGAGLTNLVPGLKRALGLIKAGADGIDAYETELLAQIDPIRFLVAMYGHQTLLVEFLKNSNLEAVAPINAGNAASGHDNHSRWVQGWTLKGFGPKSL